MTHKILFCNEKLGGTEKIRDGISLTGRRYRV